MDCISWMAVGLQGTTFADLVQTGSTGMLLGTGLPGGMGAGPRLVGTDAMGLLGIMFADLVLIATSLGTRLVGVALVNVRWMSVRSDLMRVGADSVVDAQLGLVGVGYMVLHLMGLRLRTSLTSLTWLNRTGSCTAGLTVMWPVGDAAGSHTLLWIPSILSHSPVSTPHSLTPSCSSALLS